MGKQGKARAKERREKRLQEIAELRKLPIILPPSQRWWSSETVAVVTGSNRGIGFEIARQLATHGLSVVITSRDPGRARAAADGLRANNLLPGGTTTTVDSFPLDISDPASVKSFADWILQKYGGIHILVNNAGVNFNVGSENSVEFADQVMATNYFGTKNMIQTMIPIMKPAASSAAPAPARIINVTSRLGRINGRRNRLGDTTLREQLQSEECLSEDLIDGMVTTFLQQVKQQDKWESKGWPQLFTDYSLSKLAVNAYTRLMATTLPTTSDCEGHKNITINCFCPGWVKTAMTGWAGNMSPEEGADTGVWLALLQLEDLPTGKFFAERREISF